MISISTLGFLFNNCIGLGLLAALTFHNDSICHWEEGFKSHSIFKYFLGSYFTIHMFSWYVIYRVLYSSIFAVGLRFILYFFNLTYRNEKLFMMICEFIYGYWATTEILGGWCDLEMMGDCIQNNSDVHCQSHIIQLFTRITESMCERVFSYYDSELQVYVPSSICLNVFKYFAHFIMTFLSTTIALGILVPKNFCEES